jgi:hypothetical protein
MHMLFGYKIALTCIPYKLSLLKLGRKSFSSFTSKQNGRDNEVYSIHGIFFLNCYVHFVERLFLLISYVLTDVIHVELIGGSYL